MRYVLCPVENFQKWILERQNSYRCKFGWYARTNISEKGSRLSALILEWNDYAPAWWHKNDFFTI